MAHNTKVCLVPPKAKGGDVVLYDLNKNHSFDTMMLGILRAVGLPDNTKKNVYGLKVIERNSKDRANIYIDEGNYQIIQNLDRLEVCLTIPHCIQQIFTLMQGDTKEESFNMLHEMSVEDAFITELVKDNHHITLMTVFNDDNTLTDHQLEACLLTFAHLVKNNLIKSESPDILEKVLKIARNEKTPTKKSFIDTGSSGSLTDLLEGPEYSDMAIKYALMTLRNILVSRNDTLNNWKRLILAKLNRKILLNYIAVRKYERVKHTALSMLNSVIKTFNEEGRMEVIKELNKLEERQKIYKHMVNEKTNARNPKDEVDKLVAYDLYIYQSLLLSTYKQVMPANYKIDKKLSEEFQVDKDEEFNRMSVFLDFDEVAETQINGCDVNLQEEKRQLRISLASILSDDSSRTSSYMGNVYRPDSVDFEDLNVSILTLDCLRYYKNKHPGTYKQSKVEEQFYKPGIFATSQCVVNMLCKLLCIGSTPLRNYHVYQPLFFLTENFFSELFSRTMWLLSKTRREMKACTFSDFSMAMKTLHQQILLILEQKHSTWKDFTEAITECSFQKVLDYWKMKNEEQLKELIEHHPCIYALREKFQIANRQFVNEKRLRFMHSKIKMRKAIPDKKPYKFLDVTIELSTNNKIITIKEVKSDLTTTIALSEIEGIAHGRNCEHYIECHHEPLRALNIILENKSKIQLIAEREVIASYWFEGLAILTKKEVQFTSFYEEELKKLVEMDIRLRLIDLQNVNIPKRPPKVPPTPEKPNIAPKPQLPKRTSRIRT